MKLRRWILMVLLATAILLCLLLVLPLLAQESEIIDISQLPVGEGFVDASGTSANCGYVSMHTGPVPNNMNVGDTFRSQISWAEILNQQCEMRFTIGITKSVSDPQGGTPLVVDGVSVIDDSFDPAQSCMVSMDRKRIECRVITVAQGSHRFYVYWRAARYGWVELKQDFPGSIGQPTFHETGWVELVPPTPTPLPTPDPATLKFRGYLPIIRY